MKAEKKSEPSANESKFILFRFELSRSQAILVLIVAFMGVLVIANTLAESIFLNLFQFLFYILPMVSAEPGLYHPGYLTYHFIPIISGIIVSIILLSLSVYSLNKILNQKAKKDKNERNIIHKERVVRWLGLTISHGQSFFLFSISLVGMIYMIENFVLSLIYPYPDWILFSELCWIPTGINQGTSNELLFQLVPRAIIIAIILLFFYSFYVVKRDKYSKSSTASTKPVKNYRFLLYIISLVVLIFSAARLFCNLFVSIFNFFPPSLDSLNLFQLIDMIIAITFLILSLVFIRKKAILRRKAEEKEESTEDLQDLSELTLFKLKLTPKRGLLIFSLAATFLITLTNSYLSYLFIIGRYSMRFLSPSSISRHIVYIILIMVTFYPIRQLTKQNRFETIIREIRKGANFETKWLGIRLNKLKSIIIFSVSLALTVLNVYQLTSLNRTAQGFLSDLDYSESYMIFSFPIIASIICLILAILLYTIIKSYPSIKSSEKINTNRES